MRLLLGPKGGDRRRHCFGVVSFVDRNHIVICLGGVKIIGDFVDPLTVDTAHGVPPLNLSRRIGRIGHCAHGCCNGCCSNSY